MIMFYYKLISEVLLERLTFHKHYQANLILINSFFESIKEFDD